MSEPPRTSITALNERSVILDQPWQLELFHLLQLKYALRIEIDTGLRHSRGSILARVNDTLIRAGWIDKRIGTKVKALASLELYIYEKEQQAGVTR